VHCIVVKVLHHSAAEKGGFVITVKVTYTKPKKIQAKTQEQFSERLRSFLLFRGWGELEEKERINDTADKLYDCWLVCRVLFKKIFISSSFHVCIVNLWLSAEGPRLKSTDNQLIHNRLNFIGLIEHGVKLRNKVCRAWSSIKGEQGKSNQSLLQFNNISHHELPTPLFPFYLPTVNWRTVLRVSQQHGNRNLEFRIQVSVRACACVIKFKYNFQVQNGELNDGKLFPS